MFKSLYDSFFERVRLQFIHGIAKGLKQKGDKATLNDVFVALERMVKDEEIKRAANKS
ncbi:hypothetical protein WAX78_16105 [Bacillus sp. FJAT-53711]|uniref:Uncharacterized protein n=1 Tax=Bacillus yunxiaonensis TaxID=3127665 RepID=A0ABU8G168_9BACI